MSPLVLLGILLWAVACYLASWEAQGWLITKLLRTLGQVPEDLAGGLAGLVSVLLTVVGGSLFFWGASLSLSQSWALTLGFMAAAGTGVYQLGRIDGKRERSRRP